MKITKAIIASAGFGTRFLPITKTIQKEMLPVLNKPMIDYVIDDCIKAGIQEFYIIINQHNYQILHYFRENSRLQKYLKKRSKAHLYKQVENLHKKATFHFIRQSDKGQYGTAVPILLARDYLKDEEAFVVLMGDIYFHNDSNKSEVKQMIDSFSSDNALGLISASPMDKKELFRYGVIETKKENGKLYLKHLVEKPSKEKAPSNLINTSKYIFTNKIFDVIKKQKLDPKHNELLITDSVLDLLKYGKVIVNSMKGTFLDTGSVTNWLKANLLAAKKDPQLYKELQKFIKESF